MFIKIIGGIIAFLSAVAAGIYFGFKDVYRIDDLSKMKKALILLKSEIEFSLTPLPEAFRNTAERTEKPISCIFAAIADKLSQRSGGELWILWKDALDELENETYFTPEDFTSLYSLGKTLGYLDCKLQTSSIDLICDYINEETSALNERRIQNKKMYSSLGVLGGLLLVIILL